MGRERADIEETEEPPALHIVNKRAVTKNNSTRGARVAIRVAANKEYLEREEATKLAIIRELRLA